MTLEVAETEIGTVVQTPTTLSGWIRLGIGGTEQAFGRMAYERHGTVYACASGAAYFAAGVLSSAAVVERDGTATLMPRMFPDPGIGHLFIADPIPLPPVCDESCPEATIFRSAGDEHDIEDVVIHLNDDHLWTREQIVMYLEEWNR